MSGTTPTRASASSRPSRSCAPLQVYTDDPALVRNAVRRVMPTGHRAEGAAAPKRCRRCASGATLLERAGQIAGSQASQPAAPASAAARRGIGQIELERRLVQGQMRMLQAFDTLDRDQRGYVTTKALFAVLQSLVELPGRKTLIFFSEGLPASPALQAHLQSVVEAANRANITVYAIDASGLRAVSGTPRRAARSRRRARSGCASSARRRRRHRSADDAAHRAHRGPAAVRFAGRPRRALPRTPAASWSATPTTCASALRAHRRGHALPLPADLRRRRTRSSTARSATSTSRSSGRARRSSPARATARCACAPTLPVLDYEAPALAALDARAPARTAFPFTTAALNFPEPTRPGLSPLLVRLKTDVLTYEQDAGQEHLRRAGHRRRRAFGTARADVVHKVSQQYQLTGRLHELASREAGRDPVLPRARMLAPGTLHRGVGGVRRHRRALQHPRRDAGGAAAEPAPADVAASSACNRSSASPPRRRTRPTRSTSATCSSTRTAARPTQRSGEQGSSTFFYTVYPGCVAGHAVGERRAASATAGCWPGCRSTLGQGRRAGPDPAGRPHAAHRRSRRAPISCTCIVTRRQARTPRAHRLLPGRKLTPCRRAAWSTLASACALSAAAATGVLAQRAEPARPAAPAARPAIALADGTREMAALLARRARRSAPAISGSTSTTSAPTPSPRTSTRRARPSSRCAPATSTPTSCSSPAATPTPSRRPIVCWSRSTRPGPTSAPKRSSTC